MSKSITIGGVAYTVPTGNDVDWSAQMVAWMDAVAAELEGIDDDVGAVTSDVANATAYSVLFFGAVSSPANAADNYLRPYGDAAAGPTIIEMVFPFDCQLSKMYVTTSAGPIGDAQVFTLVVDSAPSALTCTLADGDPSAVDATHTVTVEAESEIRLKVVGGASLATGAVNICVAIRVLSSPLA